MNVKELIEELQKLPGDTKVVVYTLPTYGEGWDYLAEIEVHDDRGEVELYFR